MWIFMVARNILHMNEILYVYSIESRVGVVRNMW